VTDRSRLRLIVLGVLVVSLVATLIGRLWYVQVLNAPQYRQDAFKNQIRDVVTQAPRGEIVDDAGRPWVTNKTAVVITVDRSKLNELPNDGAVVLRRLSKLLGTSFHRLHQETQICTYPFRNVKVKGKVQRIRVAVPKNCYSGDTTQPIPVSQAKPTVAATRRAIHIQEMPNLYPGVEAQTTAVRHYPQPLGAKASTILGYTAPIDAATLEKMSPAKRDVYRNSRVGLTGLEQEYNKYLRGKPGVRQITVDHLNNPTGVVKNTAARQGDDIVTYLDAKAQADLESEVQAALNNSPSADYASGVVLDARNGGIVAMASLPTYNPNKPPSSLTKVKYNQLLHSAGSPLYDKAFGSAGPPGSTFKPISGSGLIWDGTLTPGGYYDCPTNFLGLHNFDRESGAGSITLHEALVISCDTFFFKLGNTDWYRDQHLIANHQKPREGVQTIARDYGYGSNPGVDLPNASYGHIGDRNNTKLNWEQNKANYCKGAQTRPKGSYLQQIDAEDCKSGYIWEPGDQSNEDVGQGTVTASPLQVATAYAAIANGGTVYKPRVVKAIVRPNGSLVKRIKAPVRDHIPLPASTLDYLRQALYGVVNESNGTAHGIFSGFPTGQFPIGGKTGTAELTGTNLNGTWFASFGGPAGQAPQYVTVIEVNKADQGALSAAPYVKGMYEHLFGVAGQKAIFPSGVPPTKLPKVGQAAVKQRIQRQKARRKAHRQLLRQQQNNPTGTSSTPPTGTTSSPPTTTGSSPP
jgi:penicillin-binding protein 2